MHVDTYKRINVSTATRREARHGKYENSRPFRAIGFQEGN